MSVEQRVVDTTTEDNLLLGFSQVYFTPTGGTEVFLGTLTSQELQKELETLDLERGDAGVKVVDRRVLSSFSAILALETFSFHKAIAQLTLGSSTLVDVTAAAAQAVSGETISLPTSNPFTSFQNLDNADIDETTVAVTCGPATLEAVGTGDGVANDYVLAYKIKDASDISAITVGGVSYTPVNSGSETGVGNEAIMVIGEVDGAHPLTSGSIDFEVGGVGTPPGSGLAIVATYTPSFSGADFTLNTDFFVDPFLGRIRFVDPSGTDNSPFRTTGDAQPLILAYNYNQKAGADLKPFTQSGGFSGTAVIKHLADVGINFIWPIPSASILITDDAVTFDSEDFAVGALALNILDAGGTDRFGTMRLSSEPEQLA